MFREKVVAYARLMRLDKPIGTFLLLWPTLTALWIASQGRPTIQLLIIFTLGTFVMRSAGCVMNDIADRHIDGHVLRTQTRPLASGDVSLMEALLLLAVLATLALALALLLNPSVLYFAIAGAILTVVYPFMKRYIRAPQLVLGLAFSWGIPMAFVAVQGYVPAIAWYILSITFAWIIAYDTLYAMADRADDLSIGVNSTAIVFANYDRFIVGCLQSAVILSWALMATLLSLGASFFMGLIVVAVLFIYQQWLIVEREPTACFNAFLNNQWVGAAVFFGVVLSYGA